MFIGGLNWETTDRMSLGECVLRNDLIIEQQNLFETTSLNSVRFKNVLSCVTVPLVAREASVS